MIFLSAKEQVAEVAAAARVKINSLSGGKINQSERDNLPPQIPLYLNWYKDVPTHIHQCVQDNCFFTSGSPHSSFLLRQVDIILGVLYDNHISVSRATVTMFLASLPISTSHCSHLEQLPQLIFFSKGAQLSSAIFNSFVL